MNCTTQPEELSGPRRKQITSTKLPSFRNKLMNKYYENSVYSFSPFHFLIVLNCFYKHLLEREAGDQNSSNTSLLRVSTFKTKQNLYTNDSSNSTRYNCSFS